ncbi:hypothetical protein [Halalkalibacter oceani]|uniref:hypothetical protein n=1 Tax=Halalkalibacter oceani TaxID=1653776 RepID=UPI0033909D7F
MVFVVIGQNQEIVRTHYFPDELTEEEKEGGYLVNQEDLLPSKDGYSVCYNPETEEFYYREEVIEPEEPEPLDPIEELELNLYEALAEVYEGQITAQLDAYEATAAVYEEQVIGQLNTYEAIAEMYELIFAGGEANV